MEPDVIAHPQLGTLRGCGQPGYRTWETDPLQIGAFGYRAPVSLSTKSAAPSPRELALMVSVTQANEEFKELVARHLLQQYMDYERPAYRKQIDSSQYARALTESDLPELQNPSDVWRLITGLLGVYVEYRGAAADVTYLFTTTFDSDHEFEIRFRDGELYEMGMDG
jgi:hypothetical protein